MNRIINTLILIFTISIGVAAQNGNGQIKISGNIRDSISNEAVPYATVQILPQDSSKPYSQITDHKGQFAIRLPQAKSYKLTAAFVGMQAVEKNVVGQGAKDIDLGEIGMASEDKELDAVTIAAARPLVKLEVDRIAYNMKEDPSAKSKSLLEMLRNVPLVTVDGQENIQIKGSSQYKIYLNGKPSSMVSSNPKEVLRSIPAHTIKKVEVITDPGVKYDAEGVSAILNIVTDEGSSLQGYTATLSAGVSTAGQANGNVFLTTKVGKVGLTLNYSNWQLFGTESPYFNERITANAHSLDEGSMINKSKGHYGSALISYEIDSLRLFNITGGIMLWNSNVSNNTLSQEWAAGNLIKKMNQSILTKNDNGSWDLGADYQRSFRKAGELLTASYKYTNNPNNQLTRIEQDLEALKRIPLREIMHQAQESEVKAGMEEHTGQLDYTTPIAQSHSIETGLKYIARRSKSDPMHQMLAFGSDTWVPGSIYGNTNDMDQFKHNQDVLSAYLGYNYRSMKYSLQAGVRGEYDWLTAIFPNSSDANFTHKAFNWVPQLTMGYNIDPMTQIKLAYNYRISRPSITQLNPFKLQTNDYTVNYGNPALKAEKGHDVSLSLSKYSQKLMINTSLSYEFSNNEIVGYSTIDPNNPNILNHTYGNIGNTNKWIMNVYTMYSPFAWLRTYANLMGTYNKEKVKELALDHNSFGYMLFAGAQATLPNDWGFNVNGGYYDFGRQLQSTMSANYHFGLGVNKSFLNKRLTVGLHLNEPFRKYMIFKNTTEGPGFSIKNESSYMGRTLKLSVSYRFGEMKAQVRKVQRSISNDDLKQSSSGSGAGGGTGAGSGTGAGGGN